MVSTLWSWVRDILTGSFISDIFAKFNFIQGINENDSNFKPCPVIEI